MSRPLASFLGLTTLVGAVGCASNHVPAQPPGRPPTPKSVTQANPGGSQDEPSQDEPFQDEFRGF